MTYNYYVGVLTFLQEDYAKAETFLTKAWDLCLPESSRNQQQILTYLIPCRLITKHNIPTQALLSSYPRLKHMFGPLVACIKSGDLAGFDNALVAAEDELVKRRIYLTLERGRDIALRNLLRKVFLAAGYEDVKEGQENAPRIRKSRIPLSHFAAALRMRTAGEGNNQILEDEEVECMLANMIYKVSDPAAAFWFRHRGTSPHRFIFDSHTSCRLRAWLSHFISIANTLQGLMKGYISREHSMVVLNKKGAFPGTGV